MTAALTESREDYDPTKALALVEVILPVVDVIKDGQEEKGLAVLGHIMVTLF